MCIIALSLSLSITRFCPFIKHFWIYSPLLPPSDCIILRPLSCFSLPPSLHKFLTYYRAECLALSLLFLPLLNSLSSIPFDAISPPQYFSSSFHIHPDFIFRARDDLSSRARSSPFLDFLFAPLFSCRHISRRPFLSSLPASCSVFARCNARPISRYPLTCRRFFTAAAPFSSQCPHTLLTARRTLESHKALRRIFHAAISRQSR